MVCIGFLTLFKQMIISRYLGSIRKKAAVSEGSINSCSAAQCCGWGRCVPIFRKNVMWIVFGCNTFLCYVSGNPWFFHAVFHHCSRVEAMLRAWGRDQDCWANDEVRLCFWIVSPCGTCTFYLCLFCFTFEQAFAHLRLIESLKKPAWLTHVLNSITSPRFQILRWVQLQIHIHENSCHQMRIQTCLVHSYQFRVEEWACQQMQLGRK